MANRTSYDVHAAAMRMNIHDLVRELNENVGATVVQSMAGVKDRTAPYEWAKPDGNEPRLEHQNRLRLGYRVWKTLEQAEGRNVALAWLMGANPLLDEGLPVAYVRDSRTRDVMSAAEAFVNGTYAA